MEKQNELKRKLQELHQGNEAIFMETLNEIWLEEWAKDEDAEEMILVSMVASDWVKALKNKIAKEIGEKYVQDSAKLAMLLGIFAYVEIMEKATNPEKTTELENNPEALAGLKAIIKHNKW